MQPPSTLQRSAVLTACADMIRACGLTLVELAQELGQPLQATPVVLPPAMRDPNTVRPRAEQALEYVREAGGLGLRELMAIMGLIGYLLQRLRIPVAPVVLGLVLGSTLENQYRTALILSEGSHQGFLDSKVALAFFILTVLMIGMQMWSSNKKNAAPAIG